MQFDSLAEVYKYVHICSALNFAIDATIPKEDILALKLISYILFFMNLNTK